MNVECSTNCKVCFDYLFFCFFICFFVVVVALATINISSKIIRDILYYYVIGFIELTEPTL